MKNKVKYLAIIGLVLIFIVFLLKVVVNQSLSNQVVYVPKRTLAAREKIDEKDLTTIKLPKALIQDHILKDKNDLIDHYVSLNHQLYPHLPVYKDAVEEIDKAHDKAFLKLEDQEQVFSLKASLLESFGNVLLEGHRVDVYLQGQRHAQSQKLAENIRVLAVKDRHGKDVVDNQSNPSIILLAVHQDSIKDFLDAQQKGSLVLTMTKNLNEEAVYYGLESFND